MTTVLEVSIALEKQFRPVYGEMIVPSHPGYQSIDFRQKLHKTIFQIFLVLLLHIYIKEYLLILNIEYVNNSKYNNKK